MTTRPPADVGMRVAEIDTPALVVDLDAYERNLDRMAASLAGTPVRLRGHAKTHKCPVVALHQIARGAVGSCCQKVSEAEAMIAGGVRNVLVSNRSWTSARSLGWSGSPGRPRSRCASTTPGTSTTSTRRRARPGCACRSWSRSTSATFAAASRRASRRSCWPATWPLSAAFVSRDSRPTTVARSTSTRWRSGGRRSRRALPTFGRPSTSSSGRGSLARPCRERGRASYRWEAASGVYTEVQAGSYCFMDVEYGLVEGFPREFEQSLFVLATVMSRPVPERAVVDAGLKALSVDKGMPRVHGLPDAEFQRASDEHGVLRLGDGGRGLGLGDRVWLIPGHCDPTINLYDWYVAVRGDRVEALWPITARGAVL